MPDLTLENTDVNFVAAVLATRATAARRCGGLVKAADWREDLRAMFERIKKPGVNLAKSIAADPSGVSHFKNVGIESLRNALIGAGVGGAGGLASSLFSRRRKRQPFNRAIRGALLGGVAGGLGTGAFRGLEYGLSGAPGKALGARVTAENRAERDYNIAKGQGIAVPGDRDTWIQHRADQYEAATRDAAATGDEVATGDEAATRAGARPPAIDSLRAPPARWDAQMANDARGVQGAVANYFDESTGQTAGETASSVATTLLGTPDARVVNSPVPLGAVIGGVAGAGAMPLRRMAIDRAQLSRALHFNAEASGGPAPVRRGIMPWRRLSAQFKGVTGPRARSALETYRLATKRKPPRIGGKFRTPALVAAGIYAGSQADQAGARYLYNTPTGPPSQGH